MESEILIDLHKGQITCLPSYSLMMHEWQKEWPHFDRILGITLMSPLEKESYDF